MKGLKGIILGVLLAASVLMPFNVYAGTVYGDAPIIGVNVYVIDYEYGRIPVQGSVTLETDMTRWQCVSGSSSRCAVWQSQDTSDNVQNDITGTITYSNGSYSAYLYEFDFVFDDEYVGYVRFDSQITAGSGNIYYVNGSHLIITSTSLINSFTISDYSLIRKSSDSIMWVFPVESFSFISACFNNNLEQVGFNNLNNYCYPLFKVKQNNTIVQFYASTDDKFNEYTLILFVDRNIYNKDQFLNYFSISDGSIIKFESINRFRYNDRTSYILKINIGNFSSGGNKTISYINSSESTIMPIYLNYSSYNNLSSDFALNYGLTNKLLDNLDIIANGTLNSNQSASNLEDNNDQMSDDMNDLATIENGYNQNFNDQLENIDFTNPMQSNHGILPAANFVISVFNGLISNNPFSLLIIICCILLIGKKVIGK